MKHISVATYSFRQMIKDGMTFEQIAEKLGQWNVENVEINNGYTTAKGLAGAVNLFADQGIKTVLLTFDGNNFFQKKEADRKEQFDLMKPWIDAASSAGIKIMRANMGHHKVKKNTDKALDKIVGTFKPILELAESAGITFVFENHGSLSSNINFQLRLKEQFPTEHMGYLLDCGNYHPKEQAYENIGKLGKAIKIVHAKTYDFNEAGEETTLDYGKIVGELKKIGYDGYYSVEYEGPLPPLEGIEKTINLLKKYL
ncbi:MAG: sugar phosphate isomerase/epimerase family protein [Promethearchaeota archaeon]